MAGTATETAGQSLDKTQMVQEYIMHHVVDSHHWKLPFLPEIHLPSFLSLHGVMLIIAAGVLFLLFGVLYRKNDLVPRGLTNLLEVLVLFVRDQIMQVEKRLVGDGSRSRDF